MIDSDTTTGPSLAARTRAWFAQIDTDNRRPLWRRALDAREAQQREPPTQEERERARKEHRARVAGGREAWRSRTPEQKALLGNARAALAAKYSGPDSAAARKARGQKISAALRAKGPRALSKRSQKANASRTPEDRSEAAKRSAATRNARETPEQRAARGRAISAARLAGTTPEQRREWAKRARAAQLTPGSESA